MKLDGGGAQDNNEKEGKRDERELEQELIWDRSAS